MGQKRKRSSSGPKPLPPLLRIPLELRLIIYDLVIEAAIKGHTTPPRRESVVHPRTHEVTLDRIVLQDGRPRYGYRYYREPADYLAFLRTNRQIFKEAIGEVYKHKRLCSITKFEITCDLRGHRDIQGAVAPSSDIVSSRFEHIGIERPRFLPIPVDHMTYANLDFLHDESSFMVSAYRHAIYHRGFGNAEPEPVGISEFKKLIDVFRSSPSLRIFAPRFRLVSSNKHSKA
jgi:hypothetical protein